MVGVLLFMPCAQHNVKVQSLSRAGFDINRPGDVHTVQRVDTR